SNLSSNPIITVNGSTPGTTYTFGANSYAGNGGIRVYHPTGDARLARAALPGVNQGVFHIDSNVNMDAISDGTSNTLLFGERRHLDREFDRIYDSPTPFPIAGWSGWAWTSSTNSVGDFLGHAAVPINYEVPPTAPIRSLDSATANLFINDR